MSQEYFSVALSSNVNLAIPLSSMGAVIQVEAQNICTIPGVADFWHGTINFKGSLLWVLDSDRYFKLDGKRNRHTNKHTAVIIQQDRSQSSKKIALITSKLLGIASLKPDSLEQLAEDSSALEQCCSGVDQDETKRIFILNPYNLFERLYQSSTLVSA